MKKFLICVVAALTMVSASACTHSISKSNTDEHKAQVADAENLINDQPIPQFSYSQIRQNLIEIEKAQAEGVETTSFAFLQGVKQPIWSCPSIGMAIPETASLSNPLQIVNQNVGSGTWADGVVDQMDPNGIYTSTNGTGTTVMCVDAQGKVKPRSWEGYVDVEFAPAVWNPQTEQVEDTGPASFNFTGKK